MAKSKKAAPTKKSAKKSSRKPNPSIASVQAWKEPYPEPSDETMVRAIPTQDIIINGHKLHTGVESVMSSAIAHAHAAALASPAE